MTETTAKTHYWDECLMCTVRTLTEGRPPEWTTRKELAEGDTVTGVVLGIGVQPTFWQDGQTPYVDLWLGGLNRVRVAGHGQSIRNALEAAEAKMGDTLTVTFDGERTVEEGKFAGKTYKLFTVTVQRGHH
jgi:hypothetical protein